VTEVVGTELELEAIGRRGLGTGHDPGVGDQHVDAVVAVGVEPVGEAPDRRQGRQVGLVDVDAAGACVVEVPPRLVQVADDAHDRRAVGGQRSGRLDAQPGRGAGDHDVDVGEVDAGEDVVGRGLETE
jgi:hypothetical protein